LIGQFRSSSGARFRQAVPASSIRCRLAWQQSEPDSHPSVSAR
jgi:hypothetical protein